MYSQLYNPCLFQQLPVFHDSVLRPAVSPCPMKQNTAASGNNVKMTTTKTNNGLTLTFTKPLSPNSYQKAIENQFYELKQTQQPTYKVVTDFFGNEYYVANQLSEQEILNKIDVEAIGRKLAKESFQDYSLELSHDGSKILVSSPRDNINEPLQFGSTISDFHVAGCGVINDNTAMLKITVTFDSLQSLEAKYQKQEEEEEKRRLTAIKKAQRISEARQERLIQTEEARRVAVEKERLARIAEAKRLAAEHKRLAKVAEAKRLAIEHERQRGLSIAAAELKAKQEHAFKKQLEEKERRERENKLRAQYEHQQRLQREHDAKIRLQHKQAQEKLRQDYEAKIKEEQAKQEQELRRQKQLQEQIEYQKRLVEEENQLKEKKRQESLLATKKIQQNKDVVNINVHFDDHSSKNDGYESSSVESSSEYENEDEVSNPLRRYSSPPVLEDVEDDEMNRYNESLSKSPKGFSIIEDA